MVPAPDTAAEVAWLSLRTVPAPDTIAVAVKERSVFVGEAGVKVIYEGFIDLWGKDLGTCRVECGSFFWTCVSIG